MAYPSTFVDIQNAVIAKSRLDATNDRQRVKDWINQVYADVCVTTEALQESDTMTLTSNQASYTIPSAVVRIKYMAIKQPNQTGYNVPLTLVPLQQILIWRQANAGLATTNGTSMFYAVSGLNDLDLYPTPATADTLLMYYLLQPTALSADSDIPQIPEPYASKCLEYGSLVEASDYLKDFISGYTYRQVYDEWMQKFRQHLRRKEGGQTKQFPKATSLFRPPSDPSVDTGI